MTRRQLQEKIAFTARDDGFDYARWVLKDDNKNVYVGDYADNEIRYTGYPVYYIEENEDIRLATMDETGLFMNYESKKHKKCKKHKKGTID